MADTKQGYLPSEQYPPVQPFGQQPYPPTSYAPVNAQDTGVGASYPPEFPPNNQQSAGAPYPPPYGAPSYPPPMDQYNPPPAAPPPGYGLSNTVTTTSTTVIINAQDGTEYGKNDGTFSFNDKSVRLGFIRKVYAILALQMAVTIAMSCWFMFHEPTKLFVQRHIAFYLTAYGLFFVLYFVLVCCSSVARSYPTNMILLSIFTLSLGYMIAAITSFHDTKIVLMAFGMTLVVCTSVMLFACQTKYDFTTCGGLLFVLTLCLILFGIFAGIFVPIGGIRTVNLVYAGLGALLFMGFLAFDTQLIMGGRKYEISPEDYVFAAMMLYVDIIYIFLFLLSLFGGKS